jgi:potassium-dependent mechanosensitive channel
VPRSIFRGICVHALGVAAHALAAVGLFGIALFDPAVTASAEPPTQPAAPPSEPKPSAAPAITPIPIPQIAQRAEEAATFLRAAAEDPTDAHVDDADVELTVAADWIRDHLESTGQALAASPSANALANLTDSWQLIRARLAVLNDTLTRRATLAQQRVEQLDTIQATWAATRTDAGQSGAPATVFARIDGTLAAIATARGNAGAQLARVFGLQDRAAKQLARCDDVLARITQAGNALQGPLLSRDAVAIWSREARTWMSNDLGRRLREAVVDSGGVVRDFVASQRTRTPLQVAVFLVITVLARLARRGARRSPDKQPSEAAAAQVFERPYSAALVLTLIATLWIYPHPPRAVMSAVELFVLLPTVLVVRRLTSRVVVPAVYALAAFFLVDRVRDLCSVVPVLEQWLFLVEVTSGILFLALALRSEHVLRGGDTEVTPEWRRAIVWILRGQLLVLVIALFAGALGYMRLARLLGGEVLTSSYVALVAYAGVRVGEGLVAYALRVGPLCNLFMVQRHRPLVQRRLTRALHWLCIGAWAYVTLDALGVWPSIWSAAGAILSVRYVRGSVSLSVGDAAAFALTVWIAFVGSSFVRFALNEELYPRVQLPRGSSYALSTIIHYIIIITGFVFALAALGIDLTRLTILAGALGVGVGIGLQNVVANFVAGLILLLERRLHVGDAVQLGNLEGRIRDIGSRSSTIRTWDGAEVIVPNAVLTSERVTNWTLSDALRRVNLDVGVAYMADPPRVLEILQSVAASHPKALADPAPLALCTGFGDSALQFQLRVWTRIEDAESFLSDLAIAVHRALSAAKIEIPFPQRDVHIRNGDLDTHAAARIPSSSA